jgi:endoglucanase
MEGWPRISQTVLNAIRSNGDGKLVMIPGGNWSSAWRWPDTHGPASWISDPAGRFAYEAHLYFDADQSGRYARTYDAELKKNPLLATVGRARLAPFVDWCRDNGVQGYLGEYGIPDDDPRWLGVLDDFLYALDEAAFDGTYWAAGEWWGNYRLSVQPEPASTIERPQMQVLLAHPGGSDVT